MPKCDIKIRYIPATFAWILLLVTTLLFFFYPCQYYMKSHPWVPAYQGVITFFVLANFTMATFMDPGIIPKASPDEDREEELRAPLYKNAEINGITVKMKWCVTCKFYRPPRCSHCSVCNHCIETFDHHCPWVNNCIGRRNYRFFFFFLVSLSIHMLSIFSLCLFYVLKIMPNIKHVAPIIAIVLMGLVTILAIPIFGLTGFHMVLVSRGRTTNEQVTGKFKGGYNPFSRGCWHNCCYTQFGPQYPSLLKPETYTARRSHKENQPISTIITECGNNEHTIVGPNVFHSKNDMNAVNIQQSTSEMVHNYYDRENRHTQVKTYTDQGSGCNQRSGSTTLYSKLSPGRECSDTDMEPQASQSQDCEPTPPLQRHNSAGFFLPTLENINCNLNNGTIPSGVITGTVNMNNNPMEPAGGDSPRHTRIYHLRHSPHIRQRGLETHCNYGDTFSPDHQNNMNSQEKLPQVSSNRNAITSTPTMQQRNKPLLVAAPLIVTNVKRSNPSTPTQVRRSEFTNINPQQFPKQTNSTQQQTYYECNTGGNNGLPPQHPQIPTIQQHQRNVMLQQQQQQTTGSSHTPVLAQSAHRGSPQRRFLSEGELVRQTNNAINRELTYTCSNNTVDNIRELAGSPQQGMYMWKDASSPCFPNSSSGNGGNMISFHNMGNNPNTKHHGVNGVQYMVAGTQREHALNTPHSCLHQEPSQYNTQSYTQSQTNAACNALQRSNPTSPTNNLPNSGATQSPYMVCYGNSPPLTQCQPNNYGQTAVNVNVNVNQTSNSACYQPKLHGGVPVYSPNPGGVNISIQSPQIKRKQTPTRPMSFVRALEMTDSMEMYTLERQQQQQHSQHPQQQQHQQIQEQNRNNVAGSNPQNGSQQYLSKSNAGGGGAHSNSSTVPPTPERGSVYDVNYEISV